MPLIGKFLTFLWILSLELVFWCFRKAIRGVIIRDNFINTIVNFNADDISDDVRKMMKDRYLSNPDYTYEKVNRASLACGPLVKWATAQLQYADMLNKVEPLR